STKNAEDSLIPALATHGIVATNSWAVDSAPDDLRDPRFKPIFNSFAWQFIRVHPWTMVKLTFLKIAIMQTPDYSVHSKLSPGGMMKLFASLAVPLWIIAMCVLPHPGPPLAKLLIILTVVVYVVPFALTV